MGADGSLLLPLRDPLTDRSQACIMMATTVAPCLRAEWVHTSGGLHEHRATPRYFACVPMTATPPLILPRPPAVEIFVDGSNFNLSRHYEGITFDLDLNLLATRLSQGYHFVKLRYYTSPLPDVHSPAYRGQQRFFDQVRRSRRVELVLGRHEPRTDRYGQRYHVEKETDVNLAVDMVVGAYESRFDVAMLVAGDTDYVRAVSAVQARGKRVVWCHFPAQRHTDQLSQVCDERRELDEKFLRTCALGRRR
jgi:uncharacterized LabA/DUF88 family protein